MLADTNDRPGVQELYETAGNTSNLTVEAEKRGSGDVLIAAGWSDSRLGLALLRLHSEWSSAAKPARADAVTVGILARNIKMQDAKAKETADRTGEPYTAPGSAQARAQAEAQRWYTNELRILANNLKARPTVWEQLRVWVAGKGVDPDIVAEALLHWLHPTCPVCAGHGRHKVPDQPALSARQCRKCNGTGHRPYPHGAAKVLSHMDYCVNVARSSMKQRLRNTR